MENLHVCMTDATCYESHLRFPTDVKLLWESVEWLHRWLCKHCRALRIRRPRNKYDDVSRAYLSYSKKRKRKSSQRHMLKRRLLHLLAKLIEQTDVIHCKYKGKITLSSDYHKRFSAIKKCCIKRKLCSRERKSRSVLSA